MFKFDAIVDCSILSIFLIITLFIGIIQGAKLRNFNDYASSKSISTIALISTMVATWISGSGFFITTQNVYDGGFSYLIASSGLGLQLIFLSLFFSKILKKFAGCLTIASGMGMVYGPFVRQVVSLSGIVISIAAVAIQFKAFGSIISYFSLLPSEVGAIIAGLITILYSSIGGIRAVALTDLWQMIVFSIALPCIAYIIWYDASGISELPKNMDKFDLFKIFSFENAKLGDMFALMFYFSFPAMGPAMYQRIMLAGTERRMKIMCLSSGVLLIIIKIITASIPYFIYKVNPNLDSMFIPAYIIDKYTFVGLKGFMITGIIAMSMSSADSHLNSASILFAHDSLMPLKLTEEKKLINARISTVFFGFISIFIALKSNDLLSIIRNASSYFTPVISIPIIFTLLNMFLTKESVIMSMIVSFLSVLIMQLTNFSGDRIIYGMLINIITLLTVNFLMKKVMVTIKQ